MIPVFVTCQNGSHPIRVTPQRLAAIKLLRELSTRGRRAAWCSGSGLREHWLLVRVDTPARDECSNAERYATERVTDDTSPVTD